MVDDREPRTGRWPTSLRPGESMHWSTPAPAEPPEPFVALAPDFRVRPSHVLAIAAHTNPSRPTVFLDILIGRTWHNVDECPSGTARTRLDEMLRVLGGQP